MTHKSNSSDYTVLCSAHKHIFSTLYSCCGECFFLIHKQNNHLSYTCYINTKSLVLIQEAQLMLTNLCDVFIGQSRSPNIVPFHLLGIVSYCAIVTLSLNCVVFLIFDFRNVVTLKSVSEVIQGH